MAKRRRKEERIIARLRKELKEVKEELKQFKKEELPKEEPAAPSLPLLNPSLYLKKDLIKTLILSLFAIGAELVVYWFGLPD